MTSLVPGGDRSRSLGLAHRATVRAGIVIVALAVAVMVVTAGEMPFVGLVGFDMASRKEGDDPPDRPAFVVPLDGGFMLGADPIARVVAGPTRSSPPRRSPASLAP
jgi:iron complex transport system permease protein